MTLAATVDAALRSAGIPIFGVQIGDPADRSTWVVQFDPSASAAQRTQADSIIQTVAVDDATLTDGDARAQLADKKFRALVIWLAGKFGITVATARSEILTIYKGL